VQGPRAFEKHLSTAERARTIKGESDFPPQDTYRDPLLRSKPSSCPVQTCKSLVRLLLTFQRSRKMQGRIRFYYLVQPKHFGFINDSQNVFDLPSPSVSMQYGAPSEYTTEQ
jgi:hypothetical protein